MNAVKPQKRMNYPYMVDLNKMTRLKGLLIVPELPMQREVAMKRVKRVMRMTSSKILKTPSI